MRTPILVVMTMFYTPITYSQAIDVNCEANTACIVTNMNGNCLLRVGDKVRSPKLTSRNSIGKRLSAGQEVQCNEGGHIRVLFCNSKQEIEISGNPKRWYTVPNIPRSLPEEGGFKILGRKRPWKRVAAYFGILPREQNKYLKSGAAGLFGRLGDFAPARQSGASSAGSTSSAVGDIAGAQTSFPREPVAFVFPTPNAKVWAENLVFRWHASSNEAKLTFSIHTVAGDLLWSQNNVDSRLGQLSSNEARAALEWFRRTNPGASIIFSVLNESNILRNFTTSVLSVRDEETLKQELSEIDDEEQFLFHIYRADAFHRNELYFDEASEYEIALDSSPESEDLLIATMIANCRAGNTERAFLLKRRLPRSDLYNLMRCGR